MTEMVPFRMKLDCPSTNTIFVKIVDFPFFMFRTSQSEDFFLMFISAASHRLSNTRMSNISFSRAASISRPATNSSHLGSPLLHPAKRESSLGGRASVASA